MKPVYLYFKTPFNANKAIMWFYRLSVLVEKMSSTINETKDDSYMDNSAYFDSASEASGEDVVGLSEIKTPVLSKSLMFKKPRPVSHFRQLGIIESLKRRATVNNKSAAEVASTSNTTKEIISSKKLLPKRPKPCQPSKVAADKKHLPYSYVKQEFELFLRGKASKGAVRSAYEWTGRT